MKKLVVTLLLFALCVPVLALEDGATQYVGGTVPVLKNGTTGTLDSSGASSLNFDYPSGKLVIPYGQIDSYAYSEGVARHLGVLPAIGVGLVRKRQRRHFFRISYHDVSGTKQVAVLEVPKQMPPVLLAILRERAPQSCKSEANNCARTTDVYRQGREVTTIPLH